MAVQAVTHVGICVSDLERSHAFYRDLLGFKELSVLAVSDAQSAKLIEVDQLDLRCVFLERDGLRLELMNFGGSEVGDDQATPLYRRGLTHICMRVDDLDAMVARLEAAGATILRQTEIHNPEWKSRVIFVVDPDGVRLELVEGPGDPARPLGEPL